MCYIPFSGNIGDFIDLIYIVLKLIVFDNDDVLFLK